MPKRRNFLGALVGTSAAAALTAVSSVGDRPVQVIHHDRLVWPEDMPKMTEKPDVPESEAIRLVKMLLAAEREVLRIPHPQYVAWNGFTFLLPAGASVVPSPIAYVYRLAEQDKKDADAALFGKLARKYRNTYGGSG